MPKPENLRKKKVFGKKKANNSSECLKKKLQIFSKDEVNNKQSNEDQVVSNAPQKPNGFNPEDNINSSPTTKRSRDGDDKVVLRQAKKTKVAGDIVTPALSKQISKEVKGNPDVRRGSSAILNAKSKKSSKASKVSTSAITPSTSAITSSAISSATCDENILSDTSFNGDKSCFISKEAEQSPKYITGLESDGEDNAEDLGIVDSDSEEDADDVKKKVEMEVEEEEEDIENGVEVPFVVGDISAVKQRIADTIHLLDTWTAQVQKKKSKISGKSRSDFLDQLVKDVSIYYGYSAELAEYFLQLFKPSEAISFFEAAEVPRPITLRTNMLMTRRRDLAKVLIARGANVDPIGEWSKVGLKVVDSSVPVGATPEYCAGQYMIQSASSFLPVMALAPQPNELILDMAAAPGGKSTYVGQLMKNSGVLFCNELKKERCSSLAANIHRMGLTNTIIINMDGLDLKGKLPPLDRVLLDAPCTGLGVITRDPSIKVKRSLKDFQQQSILQKRLLSVAVDMVSASSVTGGYIVYSTCSLSVEENEEVIDYILKTRHVKIVPLGIDIGESGLVAYREKRFHPSLKDARRLYPHLHNMDGFFICKLKKLSDNIPQRSKKDRSKHNEHVKVWGKEAWTDELLNETKIFDKIDIESSNSDYEVDI